MQTLTVETRLDRRVRLTLAASAALVAGFVVFLVVRSVGSYYGPLDGWGVAVFEIVMGGLCLGRAWQPAWRASRSVASRLPLVLGAACISWGLGDLALTIQYGAGTPAVPSVADGFYVGFYPLAYVSVMLLIRRGNASSWAKTALDGLIAGLGAAALSAAYLFDAVRHSVGGGTLATATKLAYPVGDMVLLALAAAGLIVLPRQYRRFLVIAMVALAVVATGDIFNLLQPDSRLGYVANASAWPIALVLFALGMWIQPSSVERVDNDRAASFALPLLGAGASLVILVSASLGHPSRVAVGFTAGTLVVAAVRMALNVREGQALRNARFRSLVDKAWDIIVVAEANLDVAYITPSSERVLGYSPSEIQGKSVTETVHPDDVVVVVEALKRLSDDAAGTATFETRMRRKDGEWRIVAWTATNLLADSSVRGLILNGSDVSEARQAAEDLATARDGALMASKAKSEFLSTMSHEIRTPMNGVIGLTELLLTTTLDSEQEELAAGIKVSAESLLGIINDILDFSKIEAGKLELDETALDLPGMVDDVGRILATGAHNKGLELIIDIGSDVPASLLGDSGRLQQVLLNLGSNAVKFTFEGEVVIRVALLHEDGERAALRFEVIDMGIGIAPEDQNRLFHAFAQADSSTTRRFGGTGLGLAISRQLVDLMGGRLGLISAPGQGSTFWFEVSLRYGEPSEAPKDEIRFQELAGQHALIVDDNATNRRILHQQLASWGVDSLEAANAEEALHLATAAVEDGRGFDLGVLDLNMPGMDGIELAHILKSDPATASISLFLLSSSGERLGAAESHLRGFAASLTKPVRSSELFDCLISNAGRRPPVEPVRRSRTDDMNEENHGMILLVEDNKMNQLVGSKALSKLGYSFDIANNGLEAVSAVTRKAYDAVLMDCQMPEMDGYEATAEIRRIEANTRHTPIIAMTAAAMEGDRETCLAAGMDDYITKPVRLEAVSAVLQQWIAMPDDGPGRLQGESPEASSTSTETLDFAQIEQLRELDDGTGSLLGEIIEEFLRQTERDRNLLDHMITSGDTKAFERAAHTIKGASANIGATALASLCAQMEQCGRETRLDHAGALVERFDAEFVRVRDALGLLTARSPV